MARTVAIIQARLGSTRLPGKILMDVRPGVPMLAEVISRVRQMRTVDDVVAAFPRGQYDGYRDCIEVAQRAGAACWPFAADKVPDENDVLTRYVLAAREYMADALVRVTADCPLLDPVLADETVRLGGDWSQTDYVCNFDGSPRLRGFAVEAFPRDALEWAHRHAPPVPCPMREHVTPLIRRHALDDRAWAAHKWENEIAQTGDLPNLSVDEPADLERVRAVLAAGKGGSWREAWDAVR